MEKVVVKHAAGTLELHCVLTECRLRAEAARMSWSNASVSYCACRARPFRPDTGARAHAHCALGFPYVVVHAGASGEQGARYWSRAR